MQFLKFILLCSNRPCVLYGLSGEKYRLAAIKIGTPPQRFVYCAFTSSSMQGSINDNFVLYFIFCII